MFYYLISPLSDASSNACACNICDCYKHSHHLNADVDIYVARDTVAATDAANDFDVNDSPIYAVDIDSGRTFNTPSPIIRRRHKKVADESCCSTTTSMTAMTTKQTRSKLAQHRKSLSENDLLNEIDNALVFSKGFLYAYGKHCV